MCSVLLDDSPSYIATLTVLFINHVTWPLVPLKALHCGCQWAAKTLAWTQKGDRVDVRPTLKSLRWSSVVGTSSPPLLGRTRLRLEFHKLFGHLVTRALGEDAHDGEACVIDVYLWAQWTPAGAAGLRRDITQLYDGDTDHTVRTAEAVVLHTHLQLITLRPILVPKNTAQRERRCKYDSLVVTLPLLFINLIECRDAVMFLLIVIENNLH